MSRPGILLTVFSLFLGRHGSLAASVQHCNLEVNDEVPFPFCIAANTWQNTSTLAADLLVTFGYNRTSGKGWGAIGLGECMVPSLIFLIYGMQSADQELILSVRDGREYSQPLPSADLPQAEKLRESLNSTGWLEVSFICYGCEDWAAERRGSFVQPWIWAFNQMDEFENATIASEISFHGYTGSFALDMANAAVTDVSGMPAIPSIDASIPNQSPTNKANAYSSLVPVHGGFLGLAMMVLYPCGIVVIRSMPENIRLYLFFQVFATVSCAIGAAAIVYVIVVTGWVNIFKGSHALFGMTILLLIIPQLSLGYAHQKSSKVLNKSTTVEKIHTWLGRVILFGGCLNTIFGLQLGHFSTGVLLITSGVALLVFATIAFLPRILRKKEIRLTQRSAGDEDAVPLLEDGLELK